MDRDKMNETLEEIQTRAKQTDVGNALWYHHDVNWLLGFGKYLADTIELMHDLEEKGEGKGSEDSPAAGD